MKNSFIKHYLCTCNERDARLLPKRQPSSSDPKMLKQTLENKTTQEHHLLSHCTAGRMSITTMLIVLDVSTISVEESGWLAR